MAPARTILAFAALASLFISGCSRTTPQDAVSRKTAQHPSPHEARRALEGLATERDWRIADAVAAVANAQIKYGSDGVTYIGSFECNLSNDRFSLTVRFERNTYRYYGAFVCEPTGSWKAIINGREEERHQRRERE